MKHDELRKLLPEITSPKSKRPRFQNTTEKSIMEASRAIQDRLRENIRFVSFSSDIAASYRKIMPTKKREE